MENLQQAVIDNSTSKIENTCARFCIPANNATWECAPLNSLVDEHLALSVLLVQEGNVEFLRGEKTTLKTSERTVKENA